MVQLRQLKQREYLDVTEVMMVAGTFFVTSTDGDARAAGTNTFSCIWRHLVENKQHSS